MFLFHLGNFLLICLTSSILQHNDRPVAMAQLKLVTIRHHQLIEVAFMNSSKLL
jgi:hypothetical protein